MPEGPEIKRAADKIGKAIGGHIAQRVEFAFEGLQAYECEFESRKVVAVEPRGKAILTRFEGTPLRIYSHNQLYGRWVTCKPNRIPKSTRSLRLAIHTAHRYALLYSASDIEVLHSDTEESEHPYLSKLGPDLLDAAVNAETVLERLNHSAFQRRRLGGLYLNQHFLCGPGNYLRSEILFIAGVHPHFRPCDLSPETQYRLALASVDITRRAYTERGVTVDKETVAVLKAAGATRRQYRHYVFARGGRSCRECGATIQKVSVASRRLYFCPQCQPE